MPRRSELTTHTADDIRAFLAHHGLPSGPLERADGGIVNPCWLSADHAIRINIRDPELPKFANEAANLRLAASTVPVPDVVLLDTSRQVLPHDVLVTSRIQGSAVSTLPAADQARLVQPAARWLARLHSQPTPHFGWQHTSAGSTDWRLHLESRWEQAARNAVDRGYLTPQLARNGAAILLEHVPDVVPTLTHRDWHFGNLLQHDGQLVAAIDFEWSEGFDPVMDLEHPLEGTPHQDAFVAAYQEYRPLPPDWTRRLARYTLLTTAEFLPFGEDKLGPVHSWARREFTANLAQLRELCSR